MHIPVPDLGKFNQLKPFGLVLSMTHKYTSNKCVSKAEEKFVNRLKTLKSNSEVDGEISKWRESGALDVEVDWSYNVRTDIADVYEKTIVRIIPFNFYLKRFLFSKLKKKIKTNFIRSCFVKYVYLGNILTTFFKHIEIWLN